MKTKNTILASIFSTLLLQGCAYTPKPPVYANNVSEAKNITLAGGLMWGIDDRPLSESKKPYRPGTSFGDLLAIASIGAGAFEGGVLGMNKVGSAAFNAAHGVWATSDEDHWSTNFFYAYISKNQAPTISSPQGAREFLDSKLSSESLDILSAMRFKYSKLLPSEEHYGKTMHRWVLENNLYGCSKEQNNCILTIYTVSDKRVVSGVNPVFLGNKQNEDSWRFGRGPVDGKSTIDITSTGTKKALPELAFYKELSASMPNCFNLYIAPDKASTPSHEKGALPYNFVLNDGRFLEFVIPN